MILIRGELHSSKNSRRVVKQGNRLVPLKSKAAKLDEASFFVQLHEQRELWERMTDGKQYPLRVVFRVWRGRKGVFDYTNITQGLMDAMVKAGYLPDDDADHMIPVYKPYVFRNGYGGCEIWIEEL